MQLARPAFAPHPCQFGRGPVRVVDGPFGRGFSFSADLKLFAATFVAGFLFVSILIS